MAIVDRAFCASADWLVDGRDRVYGWAVSQRGRDRLKSSIGSRRVTVRSRIGRERRPARRSGAGLLRSAPAWSIALTALIGAWLGHLLEYARVAGWQVAVGEMSGSVHSYFFPAGAALMASVVGAAVLARRLWAHLGHRLRAAESGLRRRPEVLPTVRDARATRDVRVAWLWLLLSALQSGTWFFQENLEAVGAGHRAPLAGVFSGVHWLAPVVQAEVALILAALYSLVYRQFIRRRSRVVTLERLVARKWGRAVALAPAVPELDGVASTPLERWGAQRWQRPPPVLALSA